MQRGGGGFFPDKDVSMRVVPIPINLKVQYCEKRKGKNKTSVKFARFSFGYSKRWIFDYDL